MGVGVAWSVSLRQHAIHMGTLAVMVLVCIDAASMLWNFTERNVSVGTLILFLLLGEQREHLEPRNPHVTKTATNVSDRSGFTSVTKKGQRLQYECLTKVEWLWLNGGQFIWWTI